MFASHIQLRDISLDPTYLTTSLSSCDSYTRASPVVEAVQRTHFPLPRFYKGQESFRLSFKSKEYKKRNACRQVGGRVFFLPAWRVPELGPGQEIIDQKYMQKKDGICVSWVRNDLHSRTNIPSKPGNNTVQLLITRQHYARLKAKSKGNGHPIAGHEGPEGC